MYGRGKTEKPIASNTKTDKSRVLKHIIRIASNPNDIVFDPFMGVGSTGVAALDMDRRFIGFEIEDAYFQAAERRLKNLQPNLFMVSEKRAEFKTKKKTKKV